jgi:flagellar hook-basal body complex protein FliE
MDVRSLSSVVSGAQSLGKAGASQQGESSFSNILSEALDYIGETEAESRAANEAILTGESDDIHTALIASQKAEIAVSYAVEIRNKVVEAYNSIIDMQL